MDKRWPFQQWLLMIRCGNSLVDKMVTVLLFDKPKDMCSNVHQGLGWLKKPRSLRSIQGVKFVCTGDDDLAFGKGKSWTNKDVWNSNIWCSRHVWSLEPMVQLHPLACGFLCWKVHPNLGVQKRAQPWAGEKQRALSERMHGGKHQKPTCWNALHLKTPYCSYLLVY